MRRDFLEVVEQRPLAASSVRCWVKRVRTRLLNTNVPPKRSRYWTRLAGPGYGFPSIPEKYIRQTISSGRRLSGAERFRVPIVLHVCGHPWMDGHVSQL